MSNSSSSNIFPLPLSLEPAPLETMGTLARGLASQISRVMNVGNSQAELLTIPAMQEATENLNIVFSRLDALTQLEADEEEEMCPPTEHAVRFTKDILDQSLKHMKSIFPRASVAMDGEGGVYIYWRKPGHMIQLIVSADEHGKNAIYRHTGDFDSMDAGVSPQVLAYWLDWFTTV